MRRLIAALLGLIALLFCGGGRQGTEAELTGFSFTHGGMSMEQQYAFCVRREEGCLRADIDLYGRYAFSGVELDAKDEAALARLMEENSLWAWDGFSGSNSGVLDGERFALRAEYADGRVLTASGDNAFPEGYLAAVQEIRAFFCGLLEKNGLTAEEE